MVQAILAGKKIITRRVIKPQPTNPRWNNIGWVGWDDGHGYQMKCPYGQSGDILWVRETWKEALIKGAGKLGYIFKADYSDGNINWEEEKWRPSIFMPREACRIKLLIKDIRVERLQDITEEDAKAEGILFEQAIACNHWVPTFTDPDSGGYPNYKEAFCELWDSLNEKRGYGWGKNPWVWVVSFERVLK
jgi:hypothetical protein